MPLAAPANQAPRKPVVYTPEQIAALAAYIATLGPGPAIPTAEDLDTTDANLAEGGELFRTNCAQCHNFAGKGGALSEGKYAPTLMNATPREMYEAMITGPQNMPNFTNDTLSIESKQAIIKYVAQPAGQPRPGRSGAGFLRPRDRGRVHLDGRHRCAARRRGVDRGEGAMSDTHGKDLATTEHGDAPLFPLPPHQHRATDTDPRAARRAERQVALMFGLSAVMVIAFVVAYVMIPTSDLINLGPLGVFQTSNLVLGLTFGLGTLLIGLGAIQWAKKLMSDEEIVDERHVLGSPEGGPGGRARDVRDRPRGVRVRRAPDGPTHADRRAAALPGAAHRVPQGHGPGAGRLPDDRRSGARASRIVVDVTGAPIRPEDLAIGTLVSASPEDLDEVQELEGTQNARAKASIILVRMTPEEIRTQQGEGWDFEGILAFSKICTHVGCPIALYQQRTHHLLCPCHQSTFDLADSGNVVFGPAARRMPQLPITVDEEGYLIAQSDFAEPVGPSFWERG